MATFLFPTLHTVDDSEMCNRKLQFNLPVLDILDLDVGSGGSGVGLQLERKIKV